MSRPYLHDIEYDQYDDHHDTGSSYGGLHLFALRSGGR